MGVPHLHKNENAVPHLLLKSKMDDNQNKNNFENQKNSFNSCVFVLDN